MKKRKVIIFGASNLGNIAYNVLKDKYEICYFSDNNKEKWGKVFNGLEIIAPNKLYKIINKGFKIIIASMYYKEISRQLQNSELKEIYNFCYCDANDKTYKKRYSVDKIIDNKIYDDIKLDEKFKNKFKSDFSLIYKLKDQNLYFKDKQYKKNGKKVLMVSYIFPPIGGGGVQRTLKFVKYLKFFKWEPIVVTVGKSFYDDEEDKTLLEEIPRDVKIIRIDHNYFNSLQLNPEKIQQITDLIYGIIDDKLLMKKFIFNVRNGEEILCPDIYIGWVNILLSELEDKISLNSIDLIYTTGSPFSDHIAGFYIKKKYHIPWIADFRDEWTNSPYSKLLYKNNIFRYNFEKFMENNIVNYADKVITVTPISRSNYIKNFALRNNKVVTITNGYDEDDFKYIDSREQFKKFIITYCGSMYLNRLPENFIVAINQLIIEKKINIDIFKINFIGKIDLPILEVIHKLDVYNLVKTKGYLSHNNCLYELKNSSLLFLPIGKEQKFKSIYTGKLFEYLRLYKPILSLSPKGSLVEQLLNLTRSGKNFEYEDINGIKRYIFEIYTNWLNGNKKFNPNKEIIRKYERKNLTKRLVEVFDNVLN
ncbi:glycosyltransferase [uncultured Clostridium sp.]|uniref:glycosyltransferase n=1 Tax=uncultured Clostridium sp. TaxID=59620 RepID=UPI0025D132BA|nr:glycosyltransferase [uncultured Clostridium sp.]